MAATIYESLTSRDTSLGDRNSVTLDYFILGESDDVLAHAALAAWVPEFYGGLSLSTTNLGGYDGTRWAASATYSGSATPAVGNSEFSFDTTGGSWVITQSLETKESKPSGNPLTDAPDFEQAMNVGDDGPQGVSLPFPGSMGFEEKHYLSAGTVTPTYKNTLYRLSGTVNAGTFKGLAAGECYFSGARGSLRDLTLWEIDFFFSAEPNKTSIVTAPGITLDNADGFDHIWTAYRREGDSSGKVRSVAYASYVEKVFERENFAQLGIGT